MSKNTECPKCGGYKKSWFKYCFRCSQKEIRKPKCEVCNIEVPEGHHLCKDHWKEKQEEKRNLNKINYVKGKKEDEYKQKFEGKYYFNSQKVKSKSELLICYFLTANKVVFQYETLMIINDKEYRPDFILDDGKGNTIILEHFGMGEETSRNKEKKRIYEQFCKDNGNFCFVYSTESDIFDLKERLGKKLNDTPLKKAIWK